MNSKILSSIRTGTVAVSRSTVLKSYLYGSVSSARSSFSSQAGFVQVPIDEARSMTAKALKMIGWDDDDAALQAEIMTAAELAGNNQGLVKMYNPSLMAPSPGAAKPVVERETSTSAVINGNQAPGMLAAVTAADLAVEKVKASEGPIAIVCTNNTSTSSGQLAFYVERMARQGIVGIAMCNSPEFVAAAKGGKAVFGTNPLAVGIPQKGCVPFTVRYSLFFVFRFVWLILFGS
jgi:LDH2 family malate/lactate/ureidoglycolate dehydrogenase